MILVPCNICSSVVMGCRWYLPNVENSAYARQNVYQKVGFSTGFGLSRMPLFSRLHGVILLLNKQCRTHHTLWNHISCNFSKDRWSLAIPLLAFFQCPGADVSREAKTKIRDHYLFKNTGIWVILLFKIPVYWRRNEGSLQNCKYPEVIGWRPDLFEGDENVPTSFVGSAPFHHRFRGMERLQKLLQ